MFFWSCNDSHVYLCLLLDEYILVQYEYLHVLPWEIRRCSPWETIRDLTWPDQKKVVRVVYVNLRISRYKPIIPFDRIF